MVSRGPGASELKPRFTGSALHYGERQHSRVRLLADSLSSPPLHARLRNPGKRWGINGMMNGPAGRAPAAPGDPEGSGQQRPGLQGTRKGG